MYIYVQELIICSEQECLARFTVAITDVVLHERNIKNNIHRKEELL